MEPIKLGISRCLLGECVRYDGGHKLDVFIKENVGRYVSFVAVCPEVECGLPVPREAMRLTGGHDAPLLLTVRTAIDHTPRMLEWSRGKVEELSREDLCGFIFKKGSPSCGMARVKIYGRNGVPVAGGGGIFARAFMERFPSIPVEEEGRLHDPVLREKFIENMFALRRWRLLLGRERRLSNLMEFHSREKLLLLAHSQSHYRLMGRTVGRAEGREVGDVYDDYGRLFVEALRVKTSRVRHVNVLHHIMGYLKRRLSADEKQEMLEVIEQYRREYVPLIVPLTLVKHYVRKYEQTHLAEQTYLNPHPVALKLRNYV